MRADASQKRWADYAGRNKIVSAMTVALDGDFPVNAAVATLADSRVYAAKGEKSSVAVSLVNWGSDGISSFDYQYTLAGEEHTGSYEFATPVAGVLGRRAEAEVDLAPVAELGEYPLEFKILKINGASNEMESSPASCRSKSGRLWLSSVRLWRNILVLAVDGVRADT